MVGDKEILKVIGDALPIVGVATAGGIVAFVREGKRDIWKLLSHVLGAGFSGFLVYACLSETGVSAGQMCAIAGIVGSSGGVMLEKAQELLFDLAQRYIGSHELRDDHHDHKRGECEHCADHKNERI